MPKIWYQYSAYEESAFIIIFYTYSGEYSVENQEPIIARFCLLFDTLSGNDTSSTNEFCLLTFSASASVRITAMPEGSILAMTESINDTELLAQPVIVDDCIETSNEAVLESIENCVTCIEGVEVQHEYEQKILEEHLTSKQHGLSEEEAAVIRRQLVNVEKRKDSMFPDVDDLNLCGDESIDETFVNFNKNCCVICFQEPKGSFAEMPCCQKDPAICSACILLLCSPTTDGTSRVGRCPRCCQWLTVSMGADSLVMIDSITTEGQCEVCNQTKSHLVENDKVCDACFLGKRRALVYECKECHGHQRIPHPMYRYQPSVDTFGDVSKGSWACQLGCQRFTTWKIQPDQAR